MKHLLPIFLLLYSSSLFSQTIVKMSVPPQAQEQLTVVVLFDEEVPAGIPVVLGLMGYDVTGGIAPYTFEWLQNQTVIGTEDIVVVTPAKGDIITLKATDKNRCHSVTSFNMKVIARNKPNNYEENDLPRVFPTVINSDEISVFLPTSDKSYETKVRVFDMKGVNVYKTSIFESTAIQCQLPTGNYFVSLQNPETNKIVKIIVQH